MKKAQNRMALQKKRMLAALEKSLGIVSAAAKKAGITRPTHYNWMRDDEDYRKAVEDIENVTIDFVEGRLLQRINSDSDTAIIFYLKTKGRARGYIERSAVDANVNLNKPVIIDWSGDVLEDTDKADA